MLLAGSISMGLLTSSVALWLFLYPRHRGAGAPPWVAQEPTRPAPWGLVDLLIVLLILVGSLVVAQVVAAPELLDAKLPPETRRLETMAPGLRIRVVVANSLATLIATMFALAIIAWRTRASWERFGFSLRTLWRDAKLGALAMLLLFAPVLGLQMLLTRFFPSQHPLIETIRKTGDTGFLWASGLAAVIAAPIVEELQFRVLLQGWLQNVARAIRGRLSLTDVIWGAGNVPPASSDKSLDSRRGSTTEHDDASDASSKSEAGAVLTGASAESELPRWPIFGSSLLFALAHASHGPDPIPLFLLALGLGYLVQRTGRVWPAIVVHFLLNSWTMILMVIIVLSGGAGLDAGK